MHVIQWKWNDSEIFGYGNKGHCKSMLVSSVTRLNVKVELTLSFVSVIRLDAIGQAVGRVIDRAVGRAVGRTVGRATGIATSRAMGRSIGKVEITFLFTSINIIVRSILICCNLRSGLIFFSNHGQYWL